MRLGVVDAYTRIYTITKKYVFKFKFYKTYVFMCVKMCVNENFISILLKYR